MLRLFGKEQDTRITLDSTQELNGKLARVVEDSEAAFMLVDRDFKITYMNQASQALLSKNQDVFRQQWPDFDPYKMLGTSIDRFHKNPNHQRSMMGSALTEPFMTTISVGHLKMSLRVTAVYDSHGDYVGNALEWKDITADVEREERDADFRGQINAIRNGLAVIQFDLDGTIREANSIFCSLMGYTEGELVGKHHRIFVNPEYASSSDYKMFWDKLNRGEAEVSEFERFNSQGKSVWIRAIYAPIKYPDGQIAKVVKYAMDITAEKELQQAIELVLGKTSDILHSLSQGDLTPRAVDTDFPGQFDDLKEKINRTMATLSDTVSEINRVASTVHNGASEISQGNTNLSQRTEEQAASLEETASSMEQMTATVKRNANNASEANTLAIEARAKAQVGGKVVREAVDAMQEISAASGRISDIIGVIDEIAFQTNLLALNASVEAARAGEQGRGFAVVASEVRNLAGRSATAAKEIKELIQDSVRRVDDGAVLVNRSGDTLKEIVEQVSQVTDIVGEIAAASNEQSEGIGQVNTAVGQMDELTQQNAALVEQAAAASENLSEQANNLAQLMTRFIVDPSQTDIRSQQPLTSVDTGMQRRSENRVWAQGAASGRGSAAAAGGGDLVWEEF